MPEYLRGQTRDTTAFVLIKAAGLLYYGWKRKDITALANIAAADIAALGHVDSTVVTSTPGAVGIIGANAPKPARARKTVTANPTAAQQGSASTFVGGGAIATAIAAGWDITTGEKGVRFTQNARTTTVTAKVEGGGYYTFAMNTDDANLYAEELGLILPAAMNNTERALAFRGSSKPRPPRVEKSLAVGTVSSFCSFDATDAAATAGWDVLDSGIAYING